MPTAAMVRGRTGEDKERLSFARAGWVLGGWKTAAP